MVLLFVDENAPGDEIRPIPFILNVIDSSFKYDETYRFRFLNGDFQHRYEEVKFMYEDQALSFRVIGTDSAIRKCST